MNEQVGVYVDNIYMLIIAIVIANLNKGIKQFFLSEFVMLTTFTLYNYNKNKNILLSIALAFFMVVAVTIITVDPSNMSEAFSIVSPDTNSILGCRGMRVQDLINKYGSEEAVKAKMFEALVPFNLELNDRNAPEIATYLVNTTSANLCN